MTPEVALMLWACGTLQAWEGRVPEEPGDVEVLEAAVSVAAGLLYGAVPVMVEGPPS